MKTPLTLLCILLALWFAPVLSARASLFAEGDALMAEGSYALAAQNFTRLQQDATLAPPELQQLQIRLFAARWRHAAQQQDSRRLRAVLQEMNAAADELRGTARRAPDQWARLRAEEAMAWLQQGDTRRANGALRDAFEHWADSDELERAAAEYLALLHRVFAHTAGEPDWQSRHLPTHYLEEAVRITEDPGQLAWIHFTLANLWQQRWVQPSLTLRIGEAWRAVVQLGPVTDYYEEALYRLALWYAEYGIASYDVSGMLQLSPDYSRALSYLRSYLQHFQAEDARFGQQVLAALERIERAEVSVLVSNAFRPQSEVQFKVRFRNSPGVSLRLDAIDLADAHQFLADGVDFNQWPIPEDVPHWQQTVTVAPKHPHYPVEQSIRLSELPAGAWLVTAEVDGLRNSELILVSDLSVVVQVAGRQALIYTADAQSGAPVEGVALSILLQIRDHAHDTTNTRWLRAISDPQGTVLLDLPPGVATVHVFAGKEQRQTLSRHMRVGHRAASDAAERLFYVYASRPLFKTGELAEWKVIVRDRHASGLRMPDANTLAYELRDAQGQVVQAGNLELNDFGTAHSSFRIPPGAPLGMYTIRFPNPGAKTPTGRADLFRVEEFRLPEFSVNLQLDTGDPQPGAAPPVIRAGETVQGSIEVYYYFGGAVADVGIELILKEQPVSIFTDRDGSPQTLVRQPGRVVQRQQLRSDSRGLADFRIELPSGLERDVRYAVQAVVLDSAQREVVGEQQFFVARQGFYAALSAERSLYRQGDQVRLNVRTNDINGTPVARTGTLRITRERWREVFVHNRRGHEIDGDAFRALPERALIGATRSDYRLLRQGFETEEVLIAELTTDARGMATFSFRNAPVGYYSATWIASDGHRAPVRTETAFWVADEVTPDFGYRPGGVELIVDNRTYRPGERIPVLISTAVSGRHVLLTRSGHGIHHHSVVRVEGTARLVFLTLDQTDVPNVFLTATMIGNEELFQHHLELEVPPDSQTLSIDLETDESGYQPGDTASVRVTVRDVDGQPVVGSFSVAVVDEAMFALHPEIRDPIAGFFHGHLRQYNLQTFFSLQDLQYFSPVSDDELFLPAPPLMHRMAAVESMDNAPMPTMMMARNTDGLPDMEQEVIEQRVRVDFSPAALWMPHLVTNAQGYADITFRLPDTLTTWRITAIGIDRDGRAGESNLQTVSRQPLIARLSLPRFLASGDTALISATLHNNTDATLNAALQLTFKGPLESAAPLSDTVEIPAHGSRTLHWPVAATAPGAVTFSLSTSAGDLHDSLAQTLTVVPFARSENFAQHVRGNARTHTLEQRFPADVSDGSVFAEVTVTPTLAVTLADSLPYLIHFPYGCTEQTVSRFAPLLRLHHSLSQLGYARDSVEALLVPAELELHSWLGTQLEALLAAQREDGSWPWMPGGRTDYWMTGYIVWQLSALENFNFAFPGVKEATERGRRFLELRLMEWGERPELRVWALHALAVRHRASEGGRPSRLEARAFLELMEQRDQLSPTGISLLIIAARDFGFIEDARMLLRNLHNFRQSSATSARVETVHWHRSGDSASAVIESTAWTLLAHLLLNPGHADVEPAVNWLLAQRTGTHWHHTRATAIVLSVLADYVVLRDEFTPTAQFNVHVNDDLLFQVDIGLHNTLTALQRFVLPAPVLDGQPLRVRIERSGGEGRLYASLSGSFGLPGTVQQPSSGKPSIHRSYFALSPVPTLLRGYREQLVPLDEGMPLHGGDRIESVLIIEADQEMTHLLLRDPKAAGFESTLLLSGEPVLAREIRPGGLNATVDALRYTGRTIEVFAEHRTDKTLFYLDRLQQGVWEIRYRLRAETPGAFNVLPADIEAMYAPWLNGHSRSHRLEIAPSR